MYNKYYTLITGASEGFGKALALECAGRNMNLILVALPGRELHSLQDFIKKNYSVNVIAIEKDLSKEENCIALFNEVTRFRIRINMLINNAGLGSTVLFSEGSIQLYQQQIRLNILATTLVTRLFIEKLEKSSPAYILNVGSLSCFFSLEKKQVYAATKSYIYSLSKSLRRELKSDGISVSVVCPGSMHTNMSVMMLLKSSSWLVRLAAMNPEEVAPIAIDGLLNHKAVIIPGLINKIFMLFNYLVPSFLKSMITNWQMKKLSSAPSKNKAASLNSKYVDMIPNYLLNIK